MQGSWRQPRLWWNNSEESWRSWLTGNKELSSKIGVGWSQRSRMAEWLILKLRLEEKLEGGQRLEQGTSRGLLHQTLLKQETDCRDHWVHCLEIRFMTKNIKTKTKKLKTSLRKTVHQEAAVILILCASDQKPSNFLSNSCCSVTQLYLTLCDPMDCSTPGFPVRHDFPVCSNSCPLNQWCHPTISPSVIPFSSCLQSVLPSGSFPMSRLFTSGGQSIGTSASVLPVNIQGWFPLGLTHFYLLAVQGALKSFLQHHSSKVSILWCSAFFTVQLSHPYMTTEKSIAFDCMALCWQSDVSAF